MEKKSNKNASLLTNDIGVITKKCASPKYIRPTSGKETCECTNNVRKEKYVNTIFVVLITLYVNSGLNVFHDLMVFMIIVLLNRWKKIK